MKIPILIFGLICCLSIVCQGNDSNGPFFDEISISINRTTLQDENTDDRYGFGIGVYYSLLSNKKINIPFGIEFNQTHQFKKTMYEGHFANSKNVTYNINCISIPVGLRFKLGSKTKMIFETGAFADLVVYANRAGTMHTYYPDGNQMVIKETEFDHKAKLSDTVGFYIGLGILIPFQNYEIVIRPIYKHGINKLFIDYNDLFNRYFRISVGFSIK